jgi:hypothetical protein
MKKGRGNGKRKVLKSEGAFKKVIDTIIIFVVILLLLLCCVSRRRNCFLFFLPIGSCLGGFEEITTVKFGKLSKIREVCFFANMVQGDCYIQLYIHI